MSHPDRVSQLRPQQQATGGEQGAGARMWTLWVTLGLVAGSIVGVSGQRARGGRRVCSRQTLLVPLVYTESFIQPVYQPYITLCEGYRTCSTYRTFYRMSSREVGRVVYQTVYECCPGWRKAEEHTVNCDIAICTKPCQNGGSCSHPDTCVCLPGWAGKTCSTDVDECRTHVPLCRQR
ncbi:epidermal growth factor-like protein 7, partial [Mustelus asterias]